MNVTTDLLKELFDYKNGDLYWRLNMNSKCRKGDKAGAINSNGYLVITINGKKYMAHRLIWLWHGNELPKIIDHIDNNPLNNKIENLRLATVASNGWNSKKRSDNTTGVSNVSWCNTYKKWVVQIYKNKKKHSARFFEFDDAVAYAEEKRKELHGDFYHERTA